LLLYQFQDGQRGVVQQHEERIQKDPEFAKAYARAQQIKAQPKSKLELQKEYTDNLALLKRQYPTFEDYERAMQGGSGAVPGVKFLGVR